MNCGYKRYSHYLYLLVPLLMYEGIASAAEISDALLAGPSSEQFAGFNYRAYRFFPVPGNKFQITMHSPHFGSYLIAIKPDGTVQTQSAANYRRFVPSSTNVDAFTFSYDKKPDALIAVDDPVNGPWLVVATTYSATDQGDYTLVYDGLSSLDPLGPGQADRDQISAAFSARGVSDPALQVEALREQLTLRTVRAEFKRKVQAQIVTQESKNAELRAKMGSFDDKERQLVKALTSITAAMASGHDIDAWTITQSLVEAELTSTRDKIERDASELVMSREVSRALGVAVTELGQLDAIADELKRYDDALMADSPVSGREIGSAVARLRSRWESLSKLLADKLVNSGIVGDLPIAGGGTVFGRTVISSSSLNDGLVADVKRVTTNLSMRPETFDPKVWLPALLPWPPPDASSVLVLRRKFLEQSGAPPATLGGVDDILEAALRGAGYSGCTYWGVPGGFAIVTPLEQTNASGTPLNGDSRWLVSIAELKAFSLAEYLKALFTAQPGYFRVLMFVISPEPFAPSGSRARLETLERWSRSGLNFLPDNIRADAFTERHRITVLIYEFLKRANTDQAETSVPGRLAAPDHLTATRLISLID